MEALYGALSAATRGMTIRTDDLRAVTAEERAVIAPTFAPVRPRTPAQETAPMLTLVLPSVVTEEVASRTQPGLEITRGPRRNTFPATSVAVGIAAFALAAGGMAFLKRGVPPVAPPLATTLPAEPVPEASKSSVPAPTSVAQPLSELAVTIDPPSATVTLDGKPVVAEKGLIHFSAPLGATRRVVLSDGHSEKAFDVIVTDRGAIPSTVKLPSRAAGAAKAPEKPGILQVQREFK
jgi:hypothetical protein